MTAMLLGIATWGAAPATVAAQDDTVVIELSFVTTTGEPPAGNVAVLDLNTGTEYRNDTVSQGGTIEVDALAGSASQLQIRRTDLSPTAVTCEGEGAAATVAGSRVVVTPGDDRVVCTVTLSSALPVTGGSPVLALAGIILLGAGGLIAGGVRSSATSR